jgi:hypothetical protein
MPKAGRAGRCLNGRVSTPDKTVLDYYATPGRFTRLDADSPTSSDLRRVVEIVQGLLVYDTAAKDFYGVELRGDQAETIHERDSATLLATASRIDGRPLGRARPPACRVGARCHVFSRLTVALLRASGVPARARCGFAAYFVPGWFEDHWVAEVWNASEGRWQLVDAQLDKTWTQRIGFGGDAFDIDRGQFLTAGHAWQAWRRGELDAARCGLSSIGEHGSFWIAGNLRLDLAALNKVEMLPWDVWGAGWEPGERPTAGQLALFDDVAALTVEPDALADALQQRYGHDDVLRMDGTVFNALRRQVETV